MDGSDGWRPSPPSGPAKLVPDAGASDVGHVRVEGGGSAATSLCSASGARLTGNFPVASSSRKSTGRYPFLAAMCIAAFPRPSLILASAPFASSRDMMSSRPLPDVRCCAVSPVQSRAPLEQQPHDALAAHSGCAVQRRLREAVARRLSSRSLTSERCPLSAAICRAVSSQSSRAAISAPR